MGLAIKGSVSPWPAAPDNYLPYIFAAYMALGIGWMLLNRRRPVVRFSAGDRL